METVIEQLLTAQQVERDLNAAKKLLGVNSFEDIPKAIKKIQERIAYCREEISKLNQLGIN